MTTFGIVMFIYYCLNIAAAMYYAGNGGFHSTPGSLIFTAVANVVFLLCLLYFGTGLGVL